MCCCGEISADFEQADPIRASLIFGAQIGSKHLIPQHQSTAKVLGSLRWFRGMMPAVQVIGVKHLVQMPEIEVDIGMLQNQDGKKYRCVDQDCLWRDADKNGRQDHRQVVEHMVEWVEAEIVECVQMLRRMVHGMQCP